MRELIALVDGMAVATIVQVEGGQLTLTYSVAWQASEHAMPLSLSLPLPAPTHSDKAVRSFLAGLLPDNDQVLQRWSRTFHVSASNPFGMLRYVGEDCAGAVQFVTPDRVADMVAGDGGVKAISEDEIARRIRKLRQDPTAWHQSDNGQFSLAGAQAKTALIYDSTGDRWGDPWGVVPTTHIVKPAIATFDDHDLNEHLCLRAASIFGIPAASSYVGTFGEERAIVVRRYDRLVRGDGSIGRIHQEDMCQALGVMPTSKYQNDGGPSPEQIIELLREHSTDHVATQHDVRRFMGALAFNWIIAGTDAHAKNYSILLSGRQVRLAPLYDIASALPYDDMYLPKLRMAMRIGGEYRVEAVTGRHWRRFAEINKLHPDETVADIDDMAHRIPACFAKAAQGLAGDLPRRLVERVAERARRCRDALAEQ